ncbi:MAG: hypothetical protein HC907_39035 [Richelia sp. SM1_7_0]|nr:hypothetical protein [Richelia sp. SM1_7_0]
MNSILTANKFAYALPPRMNPGLPRREVSGEAGRKGGKNSRNSSDRDEDNDDE